LCFSPGWPWITILLYLCLPSSHHAGTLFILFLRWELTMHSRLDLSSWFTCLCLLGTMYCVLGLRYHTWLSHPFMLQLLTGVGLSIKSAVLCFVCWVNCLKTLLGCRLIWVIFPYHSLFRISSSALFLHSVHIQLYCNYVHDVHIAPM
jgi:hypothetical protein